MSVSISNRLKEVRKKLALKQEEISAKLSLSQSHYANMENGKREITVDVILFLNEIFKVSVQWMMLGTGNMFDQNQTSQNLPAEKIAPNIAPIIAPNDTKQNETPQELGAENFYIENFLLTDTVEEPPLEWKGQSNKDILIAPHHGRTFDPTITELIPMTDLKAAAGFGYINPDEFSNDSMIALPKHLVKRGANHLCMRIKGHSMEPTLFDGGFVIVRQVAQGDWKSITDNRVYVVSDREGQVYLKRVKNRFNKGILVLTSDNPDKASYSNIILEADEINTIWYVEWYFTARMPNVHDDFYTKVTTLEDSMEDINRQLNILRMKIDGK